MDKASLLRPHLPESDVELPDGGIIRVRALSTAEAHRLKDLGEDSNLLESSMLSSAMVDPEMSEAEVDTWRQCAPLGETQAVVEKILELSGMTPDAKQVAETSFRS